MSAELFGFPPYKKEACGGLWRSEDMSCMHIIAQRDVLRHTIHGIGRLGKAQFLDLNEGMVAFSRPFTEDIRLCDELLRKMRLLEEELAMEPGLQEMFSVDFNMGCSVDEMRHNGESFALDFIEERVDEKLGNVQAMSSNLRSFRLELNQEHELRLLYRMLTMMDTTTTTTQDGANGNTTVSAFAAAAATATSSSSPSSPSASSFQEGLRRLPHLIGTLRASAAEDLRRLCFRVTRGNVVVHVSEEHLFLDPETGDLSVSRCLFSIFGSSPMMMNRLRKMMESIGATLHTMDVLLERGAALQQTTSPLEACAALSSSPVMTSHNGSPVGGSSGNAGGGGGTPMLPPGARADSVEGTGGESLVSTIQHTLQQRSLLLCEWYSEHRMYKTFLRVERAVLAAMNQCVISGQTATIALWIPTKYLPALQSVLDDAVTASAGEVPSVMSRHVSQRHPPTYFETDRFTSIFQSIVDSYGMARYKEVNPGVFTIVTFPYLFGMMYGDIGHGILLLLVSLFFLYKGRHWRPDSLNEIVQMLFGGRYLLLLMSLYAIYMGVLYNDFMGFSLNVFPSGYRWGKMEVPEEHEHEIVTPIRPDGKPSVRPISTCPMGMDPAWAETENKLEFYNSVKMKCAVIVGVVQMFVGLFFSLTNYLYHKQWVKIYYLFIPEFVFLLCTFGYMSALIIIKWCTRWENTHLAPSLLEVMTNFFLQPGSLTDPLFRGQATLQVILLLIAFAMVPIMLCAMPVHEYRRYKTWAAQHQALHGVHVMNQLESMNPPEHITLDGDERDPPPAAAAAAAAPGSPRFETVPSAPSAYNDISTNSNNTTTDANGGNPKETYTEEEEEEFQNFDLSELIIHYVIHTIEYVLSTVSNTASYLRLWALSLAHAQLSEVFFTFTVVKLLGMDDSGIGIAIGVLIWLGVSFAVLVGMEALSSFLHALRLHWVEFQNKFYMGDGRPFEPLDLRNIVL